MGTLANTAPVLKWPGAKWRIADRIIERFPPHGSYVEPFFGSGAVFFRKHPSDTETINDIDGEVVNLFRVIRDAADELCKAMEMTPYSREEYSQSRRECKDPVERARKFLVRTWQGFGGKTYSRPSWAMDRTNSVFRPKYWSQLPERIRDIVQRLKMAQIEHLDARELIPLYNREDALIYVDPPYPRSARQSKERFYECELSEEEDHAEILRLCKKHRGPCIISSYRNELYDGMLEDWEVAAFQVATHNSGSATEVIYMNPACCREIRLF